MGLIMLVLIGLLPATYALNLRRATGALDTKSAASRLKVVLTSYPPIVQRETLGDLDTLIEALDGKLSLREVPRDDRIRVRSVIFQLNRKLEAQKLGIHGDLPSELDGPRRELRGAIEFVPNWVVVGVALCLGIGTMIGYERIVITVAEKIGKTHLTYAQGASAELVAMSTIGLADQWGLPVSTTQVLSSAVAGTMWANRSGLQITTLRTIGTAWILTLPASSTFSALLFLFGHLVLGP
jgi:phosphate/sulfate permease